LLDGQTFFVAVLAVAAAAALAWFVRAWQRASPGGRDSEVARLKKRYAQLLGLTPARAYDSIERNLVEWLKKDPRRSVAECLREMVAELERDRR
jgi:hypothetical protein